MKTIRIPSLVWPVVTLALLSLGSGAFAAGTNTNAAQAASKTNTLTTATNSGSVELPVPVSMFDLAAQPAKDPFFPLSLRQPVPALTNNAPAFSAASFVLKALGGPPNNRLALINNRTFGVGDTNTITTASGKVNVRCVQIKENSVVLRAESQPDFLEIFLRKAAQ